MLSAKASAQQSVEGYGAELAVDGNESTLWVASLTPKGDNNHVWFQLDLGSVKQVARLHWLAAQGAPYPASAPAAYRVLASKDAVAWETVPVPQGDETIVPVGDVLLNREARFVKLETTRVNDGTGWALGLWEIWATEGRDDSVMARQFRPRCVSEDGAVRLSWDMPPDPDMRTAVFHLYAADSPGAKPEKPLAVLGSAARAYRESLPNWTPRYYRLDAVDAAGKILLQSDLAVAIARPATIPQPAEETFAFWYERYKPSTDPDPSIKQIGNAAFVVGPDVKAAPDLARLGKGLLPYVTFYQTQGWAPIFPADADPKKVADAIAPVAFYRESLRFAGSPPGYAPSTFCRPGDIEYNAREVQYTICPNSTPMRELVLKHVREQLDGGALGFFVDNGYDDDVAARSVCRSTAHEHYYGEGLTSADSFLGLLLEVTCEVKKHNANGVVMVNGGVPAKSSFYGLTLGDVCDGQLWESYLRSSYSTLPQHLSDWQSVYNASVALEKAWDAPTPRCMFVLSYPWNREEAFFCYATAKLCNLPWSASLGINDPKHLHFGGHFGTYPELVDLRLGRPVDAQAYGGAKQGELYTREYERGLVVVNPTKDLVKSGFPLGRHRRTRDVFAAQDAEGKSLALELPAQSGRVYLWR